MFKKENIKEKVNELKVKLKADYLEIEKNEMLSPEKKVSKVIHVTCAICAGVAIQPIPFADVFILTPIQGFMGYKIAKIYGVNITEQKTIEIVKDILRLMGIGFAAQQFAIGLYKLGLPGLGGAVTIPLVYSLTYAIGHVMKYYFYQKSQNLPVDIEVIKNIWKKAQEAGKSKGKEYKESVKKEKTSGSKVKKILKKTDVKK